MAPPRMVYGKRPKTNNAFATSSNFNWSSPGKSPTEKRTTNGIEDVTNAVDRLDIKSEDNKSKTVEKKQDRALRTIDGNATPKPARRKAKEHKENISEVENHEPATPVLKSKPEKKSRRVEEHTNSKSESTPEPTPRLRRHRRMKEASAEVKEEIPDSQDEEDNATLKEESTKHTNLEPTLETPVKTSSNSRRRRIAPSTVLPSPAPSDPLSIYTKPLLRLCNDPHGRVAPTPFSTWSASLEPYFNILKIAEASYGEVYRLSLKSPHPNFSTSDESVLKIIALRPPPGTVPRKKGKKTKKQKALEEKIEGMSTVESVESEVKLMQRMTHVPGYTNFREVRVLKGMPTDPFVTAWRDWNEGRDEEKQSIFPDPGEQGSYDDDQLWAVVEMQDAGTDLEDLKLEDVGGVFGVWDIFWGVALALGKGEEEARFEHRDLHMGNICIKPSSPTLPLLAPASHLTTHTLNFTHLETTIIDYTLSRAQMCDPTHPLFLDPPESHIAYLDLEADPGVFDGDEEVEYQYAMYRHMRSAVYLDDPLADIYERWDEATETGRTWQGFHPQTNLVWLHFVLHELVKDLPFPPSSASRKKNGSRSKSRSRKAADAEADPEDALQAKRTQLAKILKYIHQKLLDPTKLPASGLHSTKDLIALALEEGWLSEDDVVASSGAEEVEGSLVELVSALDIGEDRRRRR